VDLNYALKSFEAVEGNVARLDKVIEATTR
jgi:hypothetical protein